jgi:ribosome-binding protein aMBF1 (putative translation factor)
MPELDACEICGADHPASQVRQVLWDGGVILLCITCREAHDGEWIEL